MPFGPLCGVPGFLFFNILASAAVMYANFVAGAFFLALNSLGTVTDSEFFIKFKEPSCSTAPAFFNICLACCVLVMAIYLFYFVFAKKSRLGIITFTS